MDNTKPYTKAPKPEIGRGCTFYYAPEGVAAKPCEGCYKLHETAWLEQYPQHTPTDIFEVRFKNTRRSYYQNVNNLPLERGDIVAVEASPGHDIGIVSLTGDMVARQMRRVGFNPYNGEFKKIYRKAKPYDIERWQEAIALEHETMITARQIAAEMGLNMKIGDVEYQGDKIKAIFYYIADERVDFRELIKVFAERFHIRIEMKQIGARQEAGRIGGIGACGRELCCASWISNFSSVTTNSARMQEISLNPQKTGRTVLETQVLPRLRIRHLRGRPQGVPPSAGTAPGSRRRILPGQNRHPGRYHVLQQQQGYDDQRGDASRRPRQGDHSAEPRRQERSISCRRSNHNGRSSKNRPIARRRTASHASTATAPKRKGPQTDAAATGQRNARTGTTVPAAEAPQKRPPFRNPARTEKQEPAANRSERRGKNATAVNGIIETDKAKAANRAEKGITVRANRATHATATGTGRATDRAPRKTNSAPNAGTPPANRTVNAATVRALAANSAGNVVRSVLVPKTVRDKTAPKPIRLRHTPNLRAKRDRTVPAAVLGDAEDATVVKATVGKAETERQHNPNRRKKSNNDS